MARRILIWLLVWQIAPNSARAASVDGARPLTIRVWTTRTIRALTAQPLDTPTPATPLQIAWQPNGLRTLPGAVVKKLSLSGHYRLVSAGDAPVAAAGQWTITWQPEGLHILLTLPSERYVAAALSGEAAPDEPLASLKAMAVTIRTFALTHANRHAAEGFGLCDSTHCQALRLGATRADVEQAVRETAGETLWFHGRRASVYYTQHCGGESEAASAVWPAERASYLAGHRTDPYCLRRSPATWRESLPLDHFSQILHAQGWHTPFPIDAVRVTARTQTGRAERLEITGRGTPATLSASSVRFAVDRALGWNHMRSDWYTARVTGPTLEIEGKGYGHGVGLCQAGAWEMAAEGHSDEEILNFYFPGPIPAVTAGTRWHRVPGAGWTLLTTRPPADLIRQGNAAWAKAQALLNWGPATVHPIVQELPNTELFRQTTRQPGWMLASTSRDLVFLQPSSLRPDPAVTQALLLHEFLHVLIEQQASDKAPLWLREGLAEMFADPGEPPMLDVPANQVDAGLAHPASAEESRHAHRVAESMAAALFARYGITAVRQFLRNGVTNQP